MCCGGENKHRWSIVMVNVEVYVNSEQWVVVVCFERSGAAAHGRSDDKW